MKKAFPRRIYPSSFPIHPCYLAEGEGVEPSRRIARPGFQDQLRATARHLPNLAGTPGFEPRISGLESDGLPVNLRPKKFLGMW
jgi:hypothetical protein